MAQFGYHEVRCGVQTAPSPWVETPAIKCSVVIQKLSTITCNICSVYKIKFSVNYDCRL